MSNGVVVLPGPTLTEGVISLLAPHTPTVKFVEWGSADWGKPGHNVHVATDGSFVPDSHTEGVSDQ